MDLGKLILRRKINVIDLKPMTIEYIKDGKIYLTGSFSFPKSKNEKRNKK